ncbi:MAG TPA: nucleotide sugar dehydrogenase [Methanothermococcus okinawensis]|nr:nucleotide sugar dehydrogenase [Methanothermococcus okinawensis]
MENKDNRRIKKICVIGLGYIGLPTASMLANHGYYVVGVDVDRERIRRIKNGNLNIKEPGLKTLVSGAINSGNLKVKTTPENADAYIVCVPTPVKWENNSPKCNLSYIYSAIESIKPYLRDRNLIIIESTVPPKTTERIYRYLNDGRKIYMAYCPERVLPGKILKELVENDRIIGGVNKESAELAREIYSSFVDGNIYLTDSTTAEMVKLMENTYRDVNIALANEFAKICEEINVNVWEAIDLANKHPRVNILNPGPGVGGHCISVDPWFIVEISKNAKLIRCARELNNSMPYYVCDLVFKELKRREIENPKVAIFGVAYKGNVEDTRESPGKNIIECLISKGVSVSIYDPYVKTFEYPLESLKECVTKGDVILVITDHEDFKNFKEEEIREIYDLMRNKIVIDTRNILKHDLWRKVGFYVKLLGDGK